jgi:hypothetical protein
MLCLPGFALAQDLLRLANGSEMSGRVTEISAEGIRFQEYRERDTLLREFARQEVRMILFEDGMQQYFSLEASREAVVMTDTMSFAGLQALGIADAQRLMRNNTLFWVSFLPSALIPFSGIFISTPISAALYGWPPKVSSSKLPSPSLYASSPDYAGSLDAHSRKLKRRQVLSGWIAGVGAQVFYILIIVILI